MNIRVRVTVQVVVEERTLGDVFARLTRLMEDLEAQMDEVEVLNLFAQPGEEADPPPEALKQKLAPADNAP